MQRPAPSPHGARPDKGQDRVECRGTQFLLPLDVHLEHVPRQYLCGQPAPASHLDGDTVFEQFDRREEVRGLPGEEFQFPEKVRFRGIRNTPNSTPSRPRTGTGGGKSPSPLHRVSSPAQHGKAVGIEEMERKWTEPVRRHPNGRIRLPGPVVTAPCARRRRPPRPRLRAGAGHTRSSSPPSGATAAQTAVPPRSRRGRHPRQKRRSLILSRCGVILSTPACAQGVSRRSAGPRLKISHPSERRVPGWCVMRKRGRYRLFSRAILFLSHSGVNSGVSMNPSPPRFQVGVLPEIPLFFAQPPELGPVLRFGGDVDGVVQPCRVPEVERILHLLPRLPGEAHHKERADHHPQGARILDESPGAQGPGASLSPGRAPAGSRIRWQT